MVIGDAWAEVGGGGGEGGRGKGEREGEGEGWLEVDCHNGRGVGCPEEDLSNGRGGWMKYGDASSECNPCGCCRCLGEGGLGVLVSFDLLVGCSIAIYASR